MKKTIYVSLGKEKAQELFLPVTKHGVVQANPSCCILSVVFGKSVGAVCIYGTEENVSKMSKLADFEIIMFAK